jgi:hypothetical protein
MPPRVRIGTIQRRSAFARGDTRLKLPNVGTKIGVVKRITDSVILKFSSSTPKSSDNNPLPGLAGSKMIFEKTMPRVEVNVNRKEMEYIRKG